MGSIIDVIDFSVTFLQFTAYKRNYMVRRIAYQVQARAYGGLSKTIKNKLKRLAEDGQETVREQVQVVSGTRLMREYKGERIYVTVLEDGFEFKGKRYKSLTAIATELMGTRRWAMILSTASWW